jgi:hypothetical protein
MRRAALALAAGALAMAGTACESTPEKAAKLDQQGSDAFEQEGLKVTSAARNVEVGRTAVLTDENGSAAVVELTARGSRPLAAVPVAITVKDAKGAAVFRNDIAGLQRSLTEAAVLEPGEPLLWVNDQVLATGRPASVEALPGEGKPFRGSLPVLEVSDPELRVDPEAGVAAVGEVTNTSRVDQTEVTLFGVATKGGEIVAAGRGAIPEIKAGRKARYQVLFIGDPRGARVEIAAPPTTLG